MDHGEIREEIERALAKCYDSTDMSGEEFEALVRQIVNDFLQMHT